MPAFHSTTGRTIAPDGPRDPPFQIERESALFNYFSSTGAADAVSLWSCN